MLHLSSDKCYFLGPDSMILNIINDTIYGINYMYVIESHREGGAWMFNLYKLIGTLNCYFICFSYIRKKTAC